jgi:transcriptional regulator with XRE-family HTH domain
MAAEQKRRIGERIRRARLEREWTQGDLARALPGKVEPSQVSRWERGLVQPQPENLDAIAQALERDVAYFLLPEPASNGAGAPADVLSSLGDLQRDVAALLEQQAAVAEAVAATQLEVQELRDVLQVRRRSG